MFDVYVMFLLCCWLCYVYGMLCVVLAGFWLGGEQGRWVEGVEGARLPGSWAPRLRPGPRPRPRPRPNLQAQGQPKAQGQAQGQAQAQARAQTQAQTQNQAKAQGHA